MQTVYMFMNTADRIEELVATKAAYISREEAHALFKYAQLTSSNLLEIGTRRGGSTVILGLSDPDRSSRVYSIDHYEPAHDPPGRFQRNKDLMNDNGLKCNIVWENSVKYAEQWNKTLGLLFIDGDHTYDGVTKDLLNYTPYVEVGGFILIHDYIAELKDAANNFLKTRGNYTIIDLVKSHHRRQSGFLKRRMAIVQKTAPD